MNVAAENIKELMTQSGISSITELANLSGVNLKTLSNILNGTRKFPRAKSLEPIAKYFDKSVNELLGIQENYSFSALIDQLMNACCINDYRLAKETGLSRDTINTVLRGNIINPNEKTLKALAGFFKVSEEQLRGQKPICFKTVTNNLMKYHIPLLLEHNLNDFNDTIQQIEIGEFVRKTRSKHQYQPQLALQIEKHIKIDNHHSKAMIYLSLNRMNNHQQTAYYDPRNKNLILCKEIKRNGQTFIQTKDIFAQPQLVTDDIKRIGYLLELTKI
jgi:transcriptional regulator with XRE-family HTH domain